MRRDQLVAIGADPDDSHLRAAVFVNRHEVSESPDSITLRADSGIATIVHASVGFDMQVSRPARRCALHRTSRRRHGIEMGKLGREIAGVTAELRDELVRAYADEWFAHYNY